LYLGFGKHGFYGLRKPFSVTNTGYKNIFPPSVIEIIPYFQPKLSPFIFGDPEAKNFFLSF